MLFFPTIKDRLTYKIKLTPNFTAIVTTQAKPRPTYAVSK
jgi:hypothetical protein